MAKQTNKEPGADKAPGFNSENNQGTNSPEITATVTHISKKTTDALSIGSNDHIDNSVEVEFNYPENYKGEKFFSNGDKRNVSAECAEQFLALGIIKPLSGK